MREKLRQLGLTAKEAVLYESLIKKGEATANTLAKETATNRTVTYNVLQQLVEKGLVTYVTKNGRRAYQCANPEALLAHLSQQERIAQELISELKAVRPEPFAARSVEVYEGVEGLKVIHELLRNVKGLRVLNATGLIFEHLRYSAKHIIKDIEARHARLIANPSMKRTPLAQFRKMKVKFLPKRYENYATTFILENKVIIQVLKGKPFITKIENKEVCDGYRKDFDLLWSIL